MKAIYLNPFKDDYCISIPAKVVRAIPLVIGAIGALAAVAAIPFVGSWAMMSGIAVAIVATGFTATALLSVLIMIIAKVKYAKEKKQALATLQHGPNSFKFLNPHYAKDNDVIAAIKIALATDYTTFSSLPKKFQTAVFENLTPKFQTLPKELQMVVLKRDCTYFTLLPEKSQNNRTFILDYVVQCTPTATYTNYDDFFTQQETKAPFDYIQSLWTSDKQFLLDAIEKNPWVFVVASLMEMNDAKDLWGENKEVVLAAVQKEGMLLACASEKLTKDQEIVDAAIANNSNAIVFILSDDDYSSDELELDCSSDELELDYSSDESE